MILCPLNGKLSELVFPKRESRLRAACLLQRIGGSRGGHSGSCVLAFSLADIRQTLMFSGFDPMDNRMFCD